MSIATARYRPPAAMIFGHDRRCFLAAVSIGDRHVRPAKRRQLGLQLAEFSRPTDRQQSFVTATTFNDLRHLLIQQVGRRANHQARAGEAPKSKDGVSWAYSKRDESARHGCDNVRQSPFSRRLTIFLGGCTASRPLADGRWPMADGRWPMADGRWFDGLAPARPRHLGRLGRDYSW